MITRLKKIFERQMMSRRKAYKYEITELKKSIVSGYSSNFKNFMRNTKSIVVADIKRQNTNLLNK